MKLIGTLFVAPVAVLAAAMALAQPVAVAPFKSVESRNGAHVTVRYGQAQSVRVLEGAPRVSVDANGRLLIDNHGRSHRSRTRIEIVTPSLGGLSVQQGGRLTVESGFPRHGAIAAAVSNGGSLDLRRLPVDQVSAAVSQGGMIAVRPQRRLDAAVSQGGNITYWGDPQVNRAIQGGGVVQRGRADDTDRPW